jgi:cell division protein FtsL
MGSAGFMQDYTSVLETKYYRLSSKIEDINEMIERQNSKLNNHKEIITNLKSMARSD